MTYSKEERSRRASISSIATIFTYGSNEDSDEEKDSLPDDAGNGEHWAAEPRATYKSSHSRDKLESHIGDYNTMEWNEFYDQGTVSQ
jgi:type I restriction enzyme R subunit